jgi:hypothetical protein
MSEKSRFECTRRWRLLRRQTLTDINPLRATARTATQTTMEFDMPTTSFDSSVSDVEARKDLTTAALVEKGIAMASEVGRREAASFMNANGVVFSVIVRSLAEQAFRRADSYP